MLIGVAAALPLTAFAQFENNRRPERPDVTLPDGPVRAIVLRSCTQCHGIDEYGYYAMDREHWAKVVERMKSAKSGVVDGAVISEAETELLLDWLAAEFGPDSEPLPRTYVVRPLEEFERLDADGAAAMLDPGCTECHGLETVFDADLEPDEWRVRIMQEISRGAGVLFQNAEPLAQWLIGRSR